MRNGESKVRNHRKVRTIVPLRSTSNRNAANGKGKRQGEGPIVITGGAGFIGTNVAHRLLSAGKRVVLYDNLSRPGVEQNVEWLRALHGSRVQHDRGDVCDARAVRNVLKRASQVFHFAAQVAVTTSLDNPIDDFEINARGTLNVLEALRSLERPPPLVFTSTNKVYGDLADVRLCVNANRYEPEDEHIRQHGFSENHPLHFHSPYGCSKGAACQYVQDYARTFGLPTVVFRMSCIYGPHQFGNEDQGWVAHFVKHALADEAIVIYGDGRQVRDVLFIDDLVRALLLARDRAGALAGQAFNVGGGPARALSLLELLDHLSRVHHLRPALRFAETRPGDQPYYVSDHRKLSAATGWEPRVGVEEGLARLSAWLRRPAPVPGDLAASSVMP